MCIRDRPYLYYDQETKGKQEIIYGQKPEVEYGYLNIGTIKKNLGSTHELQYIYIAPNSRTRLCINNKVLVRIVAIRKKGKFFSASVTATAAASVTDDAAAIPATPAAATSGTAAAATIPATPAAARVTTKVKRPSLSVKKAAAKPTKQILPSSFVSKGKENNSEVVDLISSDESMN